MTQIRKENARMTRLALAMLAILCAFTAFPLFLILGASAIAPALALAGALMFAAELV